MTFEEWIKENDWKESNPPQMVAEMTHNYEFIDGELIEHVTTIQRPMTIYDAWKFDCWMG